MDQNISQVQLVTVISLVIFSAVMVITGFYASKSTKTLDGFLLGGRKIGAWMTAFAYGTTYFSAVIFIGYAGKHGWDIGFASIWIGIGNSILGCYLAWKVLAKRTRAMTHKVSAKTMPEFFAARYDSDFMKLFGAGIIFIFLVPYSSAVYRGLGSMFNSIFPNVSVNVCMLLIAVVTAIFLVLGGYVATVYTDFIQGIIMIIGVIAMILVITYNPVVGGFTNAVEKIKSINPSLIDITGGNNFNFLCTNILLTSFGTWGLPQMISKYYAVRDDNAIKKATIVSTLFAALIGCGAYYVGSLCRLYLNNTLPEGGHDFAVPQALMTSLGDSNLFTTILLAVILILLLSASMSTLSAIVLTSASAVSVDLLPSFNTPFNKINQTTVTRVLCLTFVALSYIFATFKIAIIVYIMSFSWGIVSGSFIGPYLWGLYSKKITKAAAISGMLSGFLTVIILTFIRTCIDDFNTASANAPLYGVLAMIVSVITVPIVSHFTKPLPKEIIDKVFN